MAGQLAAASDWPLRRVTVAMGSCPWAATKVPTDGHGFCPVVATNLPNLLVG